MTAEARHRARCAVRLEIGGRGAQHRTAWRDAPRDQTGVGEAADAKGEIPAFIGEIDQSIVQSKLDRYLRETLREFRQQRRDLTGAERHRRAEPQQAFRLDAVGGNRAVGGLDVGQDPLGRFQIVAAGVGDRQLARSAMEQFDAKMGFERRDVLGHHGLRQAERPPGGGKAAGGGHFGENLKPGQPVQQSTISLYWYEV